MAIPILMPKPGQATEECTLILWLKAEGEAVHKGDVLFEIESVDEGVLIKQIVPAGTTVPVNTICAYIGQPGEAIPEAPVDAVQLPSTPEPTVSATRSGAGSHLPPPGRVAPVSSGVARPVEAAIRISPRATRLA